MKPIKHAYWSYLILLTAAWWLTDRTEFSSLVTIFDWRGILNQYTGIIGIGVMSLAMILSLRPRFFERSLGGLDKMYRLHKWLGITGLTISISHWLIAKGPKWAVALGWLERRGRKPRPTFPDGSLQQFFADQRGLAEGVGEWAFYAALVLMILALIKYFPYRRFVQTHRLLAIAYLALVYHSVVLVKFEYWQGPVGLILIPLLALGNVAAMLSLARKRVGGRTAAGRVIAVEWQPALDVLAIDIHLEDSWPGHTPGQFAFVTFHREEGPHPFTIASAWNEQGNIRFLVKALGDYTGSLPGRLKVGDSVQLDGPYGQFNFASETRRQIWIGGGIGITPFIARMKALARESDGKAIDLFHSTANYDPVIIDRLMRDAAAADVRLHVLWDDRDGRLDLERIVKTVPDWRNADVWFCGPAGFGRALRAGLKSLGFPEDRFHQELFELR